jgi:flavin reductase ActVB
MTYTSVREVMARWPSGVAVVTTADREGWRWGFTANSFTSVSMQPPLVMVCLGKEARCRPAFTGADAFAVHVLREGQEELAHHFADKKIVDKFQGLPFDYGLDDVPLLGGVAARLECRLSDVVEAGDHVMLLGEVATATTGFGQPLVYLRRDFRRLERLVPAH